MNDRIIARRFATSSNSLPATASAGRQPSSLADGK